MSSRVPDERRPGLFVVSGMQGAGKTTVARLLAQRFERGVHVAADTLQGMIVSGARWPEAREMTDEARHQLRLRLRNACLLACSFADAGFTAVIDDIVIGWRVEELLEHLAGRTFIFVMLAPSLDAVKQREAGRRTRLHERWGWMDDEVRTGTRRIGLWLDTTTQAPDETVDEIMRRAWVEGVVQAPALPAA